ncbi:hypothetical protein ACFFHM_03215 [Halalkalibacter kiskunsagensis]|uniref:Uncharacterized protein n=1 Tax=Halalkalibacter kiskunsagensis TaxID=1548599 RepID=A0ABV6K8B6_9BACI
MTKKQKVNTEIYLNELVDNFYLNEREEGILSHYKPKQKEVYIMKKFIGQYSFIRAIQGKGSKADCFKKMNELLVKRGYKEKKHVSTVYQFWNAPFVSFEFETND